MEAYAYFPSTIYREEHPEWVEYTLQVAQKYYAAAQDGGAIAQTAHMANDPDLKFLVDYLLLAGNTILRSKGWSSMPVRVTSSAGMATALDCLFCKTKFRR